MPPPHSSSPGSWELPAKHQSYSQRGKEEREGGQEEPISPGNASLAIPSLLERAGAQAPRGVSLSRDWP